jgi:hypothetical protein
VSSRRESTDASVILVAAGEAATQLVDSVAPPIRVHEQLRPARMVARGSPVEIPILRPT